MAKRKRTGKRRTGLTVLILLVTSALIGTALWVLWRVTLQSQPNGGVGPRPMTTPRPREEIRPSERERLEDVLRQTDE